MRQTVVIHQPDFLPYLGFFNRLLQSDLFVILDHVQFVNHTSRAWTHRDKIKTPKGEQWLTVSIEKSGSDAGINEVMLSRVVDWKTKNLNLIRENYREAAYFSEIFPFIETLYSADDEKLVDFNMRSIRMLMELFDIKITTRFSGDLTPQGKKNELLVDILQKVGGSRYLSGQGAKAYFEPDVFEKAGIEVVWQEFHHPVYPQLHGDFVPYLSSIDLLFNCGIHQSREILRRC